MQDAENPIERCCGLLTHCVSHCLLLSCCGTGGYGAFREEGAEPSPRSAGASPYQAPHLSPSQGSASERAGQERTALLAKATELNTAGQSSSSRAPGKLGFHDSAELLTPRKGGKAGLKSRVASGISLAGSEEGEFCSTCLEPYTADNPAIWTKCQHHFHLSCIYEWLERKQTCPLCEREMSFDEVLE